MDTAERLFAERGIEAVSLRTINAEAGYSVAALHYHFGTRDGLIRALLERAQPPIFACREQMLIELRAHAEPALERVVAALVRPLSMELIEKGAAGANRLRFLMRLYFDRSPYMADIREQSLKVFQPLLHRALPQLDERILRRRWVLAGELAGHALTNVREHMGIGASAQLRPSELEHFLRELVSFITGGLRAPH
ncbi:TetR/AcrR family transcriptional regulator [Steroidobacter denitrificans]|nr:TetR/AcrR family transcriptional regulator [Steroidobacter denitrificans]